jgi:hypothetical protein
MIADITVHQKIEEMKRTKDEKMMEGKGNEITNFHQMTTNREFICL